MSRNWTPPKGISIVYKGKGFRKKPKGERVNGNSEKKEKTHEHKSEED